jgi:small subunit ribosomal protein S18
MSSYNKKVSSYSGQSQGEQGSPFGNKRSAPVKMNCPFETAKVRDIDYKDVETLKKFISESGKILPRRVHGVSFHFQKILKRAIKRARFMALLPFVAEE